MSQLQNEELLSSKMIQQSEMRMHNAAHKNFARHAEVTAAARMIEKPATILPI
jgi:hypothetical protein